MKALCWYGKTDVRYQDVPDPQILNPHDAIIRVTLTAICGSDLHLYDGAIPTMEKGDILGHEFMGEIVEIGTAVTQLKVGDKVVVPFHISCNHCQHCVDKNFAACDNTNPNAVMADKLYGSSGAAMFGYSHLFGGYAGGQAQYVRVPFADGGALRIPAHIPDEKVLFLSDIFPTGYMAVENCGLKPGDQIAIWGAGPVGQFAIRSAFLLGASKVYSIDDVPERLKLAELGGAEAIDFSKCDLLDELAYRTGGRGPDACIDCVGMEAHGYGMQGLYDRLKTATFLETDRPIALREAILSCRKGGTVSIPGVYGGILDKIPWGSAFSKGLTFKMGQTHVHRYLKPLLDRIIDNQIDPSVIISHRLKLSEAPMAYDLFKKHQQECTKVVLDPLH